MEYGNSASADAGNVLEPLGLGVAWQPDILLPSYLLNPVFGVILRYL